MIMSAFRGKRVELSSEVLFQDIEGEAVLLDLASGQYFGLNEVGTRFWQHARELDDVDAIVARLLEEFEVEESVLEDDLEGFIGEMSEAGLLTLTDPTGDRD